MWHFQRIICIWICCVSCMFGTTQLSSSLVRAVPYEYFDDQEQSFYDLDSEQIQAKYDTRLLSQQMLQTEQQQQQQLENLKGFHSPESVGRVEIRKPNDAGSTYISTATTTTKLKNNGGHKLSVGNDDDDDERNDWLEETATKAASSPTTITETLDELHLPRAASCFTNGQKFTHGQKIPRLDNCEVCLCMDGEIFCWWEKCDKKPTKAATAYDDYSTPFEESSTTRIPLNPKTTYKTTLMPMKKPKTNTDYKYDDDDSAEIREMQQEYEGLREQLMRKQHESSEQDKMHHNKQMSKKKMYQQQEEKKHKKITEENKNKKKSEEQQQSHKQLKNNEQHHHIHNHNNNNNGNNNQDYGSTGASSKILNFPENLPSVLYYDYKTEEHHQHQHQHREQHLKHQKQKQQQKLLLQQQHEKELKRQQQQQKQQQQQHQKQKNHVNFQHEYGQDFNTYISSTLSAVAVPGRGKGEAIDKGTTGSKAGDAKNLYSRFGDSSTTFKYFNNGNENIYSEDMQTDSDILPEPPTNKPKYLTSITDTTATATATATAKTTRMPISQFYRMSTSIMVTTDGTTTKSTNTREALTDTTPTASVGLKKQIFSPWDYNKPNRDNLQNNNKKYGNGNTNSNKNTNNNKSNESFEDTIDTDDQDDAFHRWLTSTEKNNKNNFTINDAIIRRADDDDDGLDVVAVGSGLDASNNDYNVDERNYENINWETDTGLATLTTKTKAAMRHLTIKGAAAASTTTAINAFNIAEPVAAGGETAIYYENIQKPNYEQNFSENNSYNNNSNTITTSNGIIMNHSNNKSNNNNYNSPFSRNAYQNNKMGRPTIGSGGVTSSTASNEENGVASVVNIDIMLTASSADPQNLMQPQQTNIVETTNQHRQLQLQDLENEKQNAKTQLKFIQPQVLISNTNDVDNKNSLYSIINDNTRNFNESSSNNNKNNNNKNNKNITNIVGNGLNIKERSQLQNVGVNLSSTNSNSNSNNNFNNKSASSQSLSSSSDSFKFNHISAVLSQPNVTSAAATLPPPLSTTSTSSPERLCNVMGTLYKIGDVLPQDTGNCLQCICIDGSTSDDTPRVTCSPHNCPPLVLPDLFDATGY